MSAESLFKLIIIIVLMFIFFKINFGKHIGDINIALPGHLRDIATRDLTYVGCYNERLSVSLNIWLYHVIVLCNTQYGWVDIRKLMRNWEEVIYDPEGIIKDAITSSLRKYDTIVRDAKQSDTEPNFKIAVGYDYHELPVTMRCNDYCNINYLIDCLDEEIGGN